MCDVQRIATSREASSVQGIYSHYALLQTPSLHAEQDDYMRMRSLDDFVTSMNTNLYVRADGSQAFHLQELNHYH